MRQRTGDDIAQAFDASREACRLQVIGSQSGKDLPQLRGGDSGVRSCQTISPLTDDALDHRGSILVDGQQRTRRNALRHGVAASTRFERVDLTLAEVTY